MNRIFLDTGYVLALELASDQHHRSVSDHWNALAGKLPALLTTSSVFTEIVTFFNTRGHHQKAIEVGNHLLQSTAIDIVHVDGELHDAGWQLLQQHQDKRYSLADCISFVVMQRLGVNTAFTIDHHFEQAGFQIEPRPRAN